MPLVKLTSFKQLLSRFQSWAWMFAFLGFVSPGILSYSPYTIMWDEAFYAHRIVCMNREFYSLSLQGMAGCLAGAHKAPIIQLVGLPWGRAGSTEAGIGLAFVGLAFLNFALALLAYRVCVRAGIAPWCLALAGAGIGMAPLVRENGGALMTDVLVAWCAALSVMLIALEFRTRDDGRLSSFFRGGLWATVFTIGSLAKMTFAFFGVASVAILIYARWRRCGRQAVFYTALGGLAFAVPGLMVWVFCGPAMVNFGLLAAFGKIAALYGVPGLTPAGYVWGFFSGLGFALIPMAALLTLFLRGILAERARLLPVAVVLGYLLTVAMGQNRDPRYGVAIAVELPLALAWNSLPSSPSSFDSAHFLGGLLVALLVAIPMVARPRLEPTRHGEELLLALSRGRPATLVIATDGPEYNIETLQLARQIGGASLQSAYLDTLVYDAINKRTLENGYERMARANYVLFLKARFPAGPDWSRQWAAQYRTYAEEHGTLLASQSLGEFDVFEMNKP